MKKILFFSALIFVLLLSVLGCEKEPTLVYIVDGEIYHTDVIQSEDSFFGNIGKEPAKEGFVFGGWYYDDGTWEKPLSYTELNRQVEGKEYRVYAKWETVKLEYLAEERAYAVVGLLKGAGNEVVIPENYKDMPIISIAPEAFRGNDKLTSVVLPDTVKSIGEYAFAECTALAKIAIPNSVDTIGKGAFSNCALLAEASLGTAVRYIHSEAFFNCKSLVSITVPSATKSIGARAFASTSSLSSVSLPFGILSVGAEAFAGSGVVEITYAGQTADWQNVTHKDFAQNSSLTGVKCLDGVVPVA